MCTLIINIVYSYELLFIILILMIFIHFHWILLFLGFIINVCGNENICRILITPVYTYLYGGIKNVIESWVMLNSRQAEARTGVAFSWFYNSTSTEIQHNYIFHFNLCKMCRTYIIPLLTQFINNYYVIREQTLIYCRFVSLISLYW